MSCKPSQVVHGQWSNRLTYVLAATGAAVGLGNIWKFPYIMGENGGGAFVLVYLACIAIIGVPVMIAEVYLGKQGRQSPMRSVARVVQENKSAPAWRFVGAMGVIAGYLILSFYAVVAGWALAYVFKAAGGGFAGASPAYLQDTFELFVSSPVQLLSWTSIVLIVTVVVVAKGVQNGLEKATRFMMPGMLVLLLFIVGYSAVYGDFTAAFNFMFAADFDKLTTESVLTALGHSFFSLSLASGIMIMYGAYLPKNTSIIKSSIWIAIADTCVALLAGLAIFPIVFAFQLEPGAGPGLIFQTLPLAFGQMPGGRLLGSLFFIMLVFAAFTSAIALIESSVAWLIESKGFSRVQAAIAAGFGLWLLSLLSIFSFVGHDWTRLALFGTSHSLFEWIDSLTANVMLPLGGFFISLFVGWKVAADRLNGELNINTKQLTVLRVLLQFICPLIILLVFLNLIGVL
ncbi:sodium-dependent transporter [Gayadomonas joobiniege]|uniref:sodium-dependent transporter n=1 Tax=Gayadomonas joobiniege TaxID=1234606 RepID=UPI00037A0F20|nr:sodium-dependent transporter [Gayadomonas joobiniege]